MSEKHNPWHVGMVASTVGTVVGGLIVAWLLKLKPADVLDAVAPAFRWLLGLIAQPIGFSAPLWLWLLVLGITVTVGRAWVRRRRNASAKSDDKVPTPAPSLVPVSLPSVTEPPATPPSVNRLEQPTVGGGDGKIVLDKSPKDLVAPFKNLTHYQATKLVEDYYGKWVEWELVIDNVSKIHDQAYVAAKLGPFVFLYFDPTETAKVVHLEKETVIRIEGEIESINQIDVRLTNCRLLSAKSPGPTD